MSGLVPARRRRETSARKSRPLTAEEKALAERHLHLCRVAARHFCKRYAGISEAEYASAAFDGLADAAKSFDPGRGVTFASFADKRIMGAVGDMLRRQRGRVVHVGRVTAARGPERKTFSVDEVHADFAASTPPPGREMEAAEGFEALLVHLSARERTVIRALYGPESLTQLEVSRRLDVCPNRVSQIHAEVMPRIAARAVRLGLVRPSEVAPEYRSCI